MPSLTFLPLCSAAWRRGGLAAGAGLARKGIISCSGGDRNQWRGGDVFPPPLQSSGRLLLGSPSPCAVRVPLTTGRRQGEKASTSKSLLLPDGVQQAGGLFFSTSD